MVHKMPVADFSADTLVGCSPMAVNFSNIRRPMDDPYKTIEWTIMGETIISNTDQTIVFDKPGAYDISLKVTTVYGCENTDLRPNYINVYPSPRADFLLSPEIAQITDPEIEFIDLSSDADEIFYVVTLSSGPDIINQPQPTYTFPDTGLYDVRQVVSKQFDDGFTCVDSLTKQAVVELGYKYFIPAGFSPNGDGLNDYFKVSGEDVIDFSMIVYNRWGQKLYQSFDMDNGWDGKTKLGDEVVDGGVYFYRVEMTQRNGLKNTIEGHVQIIK
jgi:gliding motility-associated-like protein